MIKRTIKLTLLLLASVSVCKSQDINTKYPFDMGNLRLSKNYSIFQQLKNTEVRRDTIFIYNTWDQEMTFEFRDIKHLKHLSIYAEPSPLPPGHEGVIVVVVDGRETTDFGNRVMSVGIYTNDSKQGVKRLTLNTNLVEDFSVMSEEELNNAPKISFNTQRYNFGTVKSGEKISYDFIITNTGNSDLIIRSVKPSCGCTASQPGKSVLKPGESTNVSANFNTSGRRGRQMNSITLISNDPHNPTVSLVMEGVLEL